MMPLLFYSNNCPHSNKLVAGLRRTPDIDNVIRFVCIDGQLDKIPPEIHSVPALLIPTSEGNRVVFETEMYEWINGAIRMLQNQQSAGGKRREQQQQQPPPSAGQGAFPEAFIDNSDAMLCNLQGSGDSAGHLFAGAGEEIRIPYIDDNGDTSVSSTVPASSRRDRQSSDDDIINKMMASRNQEISSVYSQMTRPV